MRMCCRRPLPTYHHRCHPHLVILSWSSWVVEVVVIIVIVIVVVIVIVIVDDWIAGRNETSHAHHVERYCFRDDDDDDDDDDCSK